MCVEMYRYTLIDINQSISHITNIALKSEYRRMSIHEAVEHWMISSSVEDVVRVRMTQSNRCGEGEFCPGHADSGPVRVRGAAATSEKVHGHQRAGGASVCIT